MTTEQDIWRGALIDFVCAVAISFGGTFLLAYWL